MKEKLLPNIDSVNVKTIQRADTIELHFNKGVEWIGLTPTQAIKIAEDLRACAISILREAAY